MVVSPLYQTVGVNLFHVKSVSNRVNTSTDHSIFLKRKCCSVIAVSEWSLCSGVKMCIRSHYRQTLCLLNSKWPHAFSFPMLCKPKADKTAGQGPRQIRGLHGLQMKWKGLALERSTCGQFTGILSFETKCLHSQNFRWIIHCNPELFTFLNVARRWY